MKYRPDAKEFLANLAGPMPPWKKLSLFIRNNYSKLRHGTNCCGHPGEPGC